MLSALESQGGVKAVLGVAGRAKVGSGCRFQDGVTIAVGVLPEEVILGAPLVVAPFLLPPNLGVRVDRWKIFVNLSVVLLGVHGPRPRCWLVWRTCP